VKKQTTTMYKPSLNRKWNHWLSLNTACMHVRYARKNESANNGCLSYFYRRRIKGIKAYCPTRDVDAMGDLVKVFLIQMCAIKIWTRL
jgi:hypothetical protein